MGTGHELNGQGTLADLWFVTLTTVSWHSSPINSTSYSISRTILGMAESTSSLLVVYHTLNSTVPGYPSSPSLLKYLKSTASFPFLFTVIGPSKNFLSHPCSPPCSELGPLFFAKVYVRPLRSLMTASWIRFATRPMVAP